METNRKLSWISVLEPQEMRGADSLRARAPHVRVITRCEEAEDVPNPFR
jgi:hypothetical protein